MSNTTTKYNTIEEWIERNPNHIGGMPIEVCRQIFGTKEAEFKDSLSRSIWDRLEVEDLLFKLTGVKWVPKSNTPQHKENA